MLTTIKHYLRNLVLSTQENNRKNILSLIEKNPKAKLIDLGCDEGSWTRELGRRLGSTDLYGSEVVEHRRQESEEKEIKTYNFDLNRPFPLDDDCYDVVHSNQVIEHLFDTDNFVSESFRILKPGGYTIVSTVNLASWHNIFALILGYQPFDFANISIKGTIGNPFSLWKNEMSVNELKSWQHVRLFTPYSLKDYYKKYGFKYVDGAVSGYYPLPSVFASLDFNHAHMFALKLQKPKR